MAKKPQPKRDDVPPVDCPRCKGSGSDPYYEGSCIQCGGTGKV